MKNIIKDERGFFSTISLVLSLVIVAVTFWIFMPFYEMLTMNLIELGGNAPVSVYLFYLSCARWGFTIFALAAIVIYIIKVYRKETVAVPIY